MPGAVQLWVTAAAGPAPAAARNARRCRSRPACAGRSRSAAYGHRTATPVVSAIGEAAIALQLMPDTCRRRTAAVILTLAKNNRGPGERPEGRHGRPARGFCPWPRRALMCGASLSYEQGCRAVHKQTYE